MGAWDGEVKTPFGSYPKKNVAIVGAAIVALAVIVWYRQKNSSPYDPTAAGQSEINPATGYPYGSVEDAAAMARQAEYQFPGGGGGGTGTPGDGSQPRFTSNAQWSQYVITYVSDNDIVSDVGPMAAALGKYLSGQPVDAAQTSLIEQAIAIADKPPLAGPTGYPPSINTAPVTPPPTGGGGSGSTVEWATVLAGFDVNDWIADYRVHPESKNRNLTYALLNQLNPTLPQNITPQGKFRAYGVYRVL